MWLGHALIQIHYMRNESTSGRVGSDLRRLAYRVERFLRLEAAERLTVVTSCVILAAIIFALATSAIFFLSTGVVKSLTLLTGDEMVSYYLVGLLLVALILLVYLLRKPLIEKQLVQLFSQQLLEGPSLTEQFTAKQGGAEERLHNLAQSLAQELDDGTDDYDEEGGGI